MLAHIPTNEEYSQFTVERVFGKHAEYFRIIYVSQRQIK
jgi:hypothetical protein